MLITLLKAKEELAPLLDGKKVFILNCLGCSEMHFPEEAFEFEKELEENNKVTGKITVDYVCNPENLDERFKYRKAEIDEADVVLVFSCGVGVQTVAEKLYGKKVVAACNTLKLPGTQGVTPLSYDCEGCGECHLNMTAGICPITACSKSLVNGQCGGAKNGMCEVDPTMPCGWERIQKRLEGLGKLDNLKTPTRLHDFSTFMETKEHKEC